MKIALAVVILSLPLFAKECYFTKNSKVCFYPFFDTKKLKNPKYDERYYKFKDGYVYTMKDKIKITLNYLGGILHILETYEVEFFDKKDHDTFILRVKNPNELFSVVTNLNRLNSVKLAEPLIQRKDYKPFNGR